MNRTEKAAVIDQIAERIDASEAIFAVDYRGISVTQVTELREKLRAADASFQVVKNSLTERAADKAGAESLKELLAGPTALTFVRGDTALAAKAIADFGRATNLLPFKGGRLGGEAISIEQLQAIAKLPARDVLYGQLVGIVAAPLSGLVRGLNALLGGVAIALGQIAERGLLGTAAEAERAPEAAPEPEAEAAPEAEPAPEATPDENQADAEASNEAEEEK